MIMAFRVQYHKGCCTENTLEWTPILAASTMGVCIWCSLSLSLSLSKGAFAIWAELFEGTSLRGRLLYIYDILYAGVILCMFCACFFFCFFYKRSIFNFCSCVVECGSSWFISYLQATWILKVNLLENYFLQKMNYRYLIYIHNVLDKQVFMENWATVCLSIVH